jgi:hypothetical protein
MAICNFDYGSVKIAEVMKDDFAAWPKGSGDAVHHNFE